MNNLGGPDWTSSPKLKRRRTASYLIHRWPGHTRGARQKPLISAARRSSETSTKRTASGCGQHRGSWLQSRQAGVGEGMRCPTPWSSRERRPVAPALPRPWNLNAGRFRREPRLRNDSQRKSKRWFWPEARATAAAACRAQALHASASPAHLSPAVPSPSWCPQSRTPGAPQGRALGRRPLCCGDPLSFPGTLHRAAQHPTASPTYLAAFIERFL